LVLQNQPDASEVYVLQAELLVDTLSTQKPLFQRGVSEYELIEKRHINFLMTLRYESL